MAKTKHIFVYPPTLPYDKLYQRPQQLCKALASLGHEVYFCEHPQNDQISSNEFSIYKKDGVNIVTSGWRNVVAKLKDYIFFTSWAKYNGDSLIKTPNRLLTIYDCLDNFPEWEPYEKKIFLEADLVLCSSDANKERAQAVTKAQLLMVPNAADVARFFPDNLEKRQPEQLANIPRTIRALFTGCVADWVDLALIKEAAKSRADIHFIFVGEVWGMDNKNFFKKNSLRNIHHIGHVPHEDLPYFMQSCNVGIVPFKLNNKVTEAADPIKVWEYIASGLPVVSTSLRECYKFHPYIRLQDEPVFFAAAISQEANGDTPEKRLDRLKWASSHTWENRAKAILKAVNRLLR